MKKRSTYRPRTQLLDPLAYVLSGLRPVSTSHEYMTTVRIKNHSAILAVTKGEATIQDVDNLIAAFNVAEALSHLGQGAHLLTEIRAAQDALRSAGERPKYRFTGPELSAVNHAMDIHDAQLDSPATTVGMLQEALEIVVKVIRAQKATRIKFEVPA